MAFSRDLLQIPEWVQYLLKQRRRRRRKQRFQRAPKAPCNPCQSPEGTQPNLHVHPHCEQVSMVVGWSGAPVESMTRTGPLCCSCFFFLSFSKTSPSQRINAVPTAEGLSRLPEQEFEDCTHARYEQSGVSPRDEECPLVPCLNGYTKANSGETHSRGGDRIKGAFSVEICRQDNSERISQRNSYSVELSKRRSWA